MSSPAPAEDTPYRLLGGDTGVRRLVDRFYGLMDAVPEYHGIRKLHPQDLAGSREKLYLFLSGWLGGPPLYVEKYGHAPASSKQGSRLRDAHVRESGASPQQAPRSPTGSHPKGALLRPSATCCARGTCPSPSASPSAMPGRHACMLQAMEDNGIEEPLRAGLRNAFFGTADWMRNRPESAYPES